MCLCQPASDVSWRVSEPDGAVQYEGNLDAKWLLGDVIAEGTKVGW